MTPGAGPHPAHPGTEPLDSPGRRPVPCARPGAVRDKLP
jgi:hypothetical protein